jgi:peptidoglycan endopeptidase LytE
MSRIIPLLFLLTGLFYTMCQAETITQTHTVKKGESLSIISKKYQVPVKKILEWNNRSSSKILPGERLIVKKVVQKKSVTEKTKKSNITVSQLGKIYTVQRGETLSAISRKTGLSVTELMELNSLRSTQLAIGQRLLIEKSEEKEEPAHIEVAKESHSEQESEIEKSPSSTPASALATTQTIWRTTTHTVKRGESLSSIAKKYKVSLSSLLQLNRIKKSKTIQPGQVLVVRRVKQTVAVTPAIEPTPIVSGTQKTYYTVKFGDTIESIARNFGISIDTLRSSNLLFDNRLRMGQTLVIPEYAEKNRLKTESETSLSMDPFDGPSSDFTKQLALKIVDNALKFLNTPYRYGAASESCTDCSGLVKQVYNKSGISVPRSSREQFQQGEAIAIDKAKPGDLVFFKKSGRISHVGIYLGDGKFVHASTNLRKVVVSNLDESYYKNHFAGMRSYFAENESYFGDSYVLP